MRWRSSSTTRTAVNSRKVLRVLELHAAALNRPLAVEDDPDRLWIEAMFLDQNPLRQRVDRVVVSDRYGRLQDDRTAVQFVRDQMDGRAADPHAVVERLL